MEGERDEGLLGQDAPGEDSAMDEEVGKPTELLWPPMVTPKSGESKRGDETPFLTPPASSLGKRRLSQRSSFSKGTSPLSSEEWHRSESSSFSQRRHSTPPCAPVPKAWSSLVLPATEPADEAVDLECHATPVLLAELSDLRNRYQAVLRTNEELRAENRKLKSFLPKPRALPTPVNSGSYKFLQSPNRKGEAGRNFQDDSYGLGDVDVDVDKILQAEYHAGDDAQVARTKVAMRQMMSVSTLLKSLRQTVDQDSKSMEQVLNQAEENTRLLQEARARTQELESELRSLRGEHG